MGEDLPNLLKSRRILSRLAFIRDDLKAIKIIGVEQYELKRMIESAEENICKVFDSLKKEVMGE